MALIATFSLWAEDFEADGIYYNILDGNNVEVTYRGSSYYEYSGEYSGEVTIPKTITYDGIIYSVTSIGSSAFEDCSSLTSITIPNSVTSIGRYAFWYCFSLTSITIPNSVTSIGEHAFSGCSALTSMVVEEGNTTYDSRDNCNAIIKTATNSLIAGCQNTIIPYSVTSIGGNAFRDCSSLTSLTIPNSVTSIGNAAFCSCSSLTSMVVEEGNTTYDSRDNCNAIIETATNTLIAGCQNTIIPNSVTSIGSNAFCGCSDLTSITIPNSVTSIGWSAFENTGIYHNEANWENGVLYISNCLIAAKNDISGSYAIKEDTRILAGEAFAYCHSLTSITIPESVTSIGDKAFRDCSSLKSVVWNAKKCEDFTYNFNPFNGSQSQITSFIIGDRVEHIPAYLCYNMASLTSVTIPSSVTSIGSSAFLKCSRLCSITIPNSVTSIGNTAFSGCSSLTKTNYTGNVADWCNIQFGDGNANPIRFSHNFYINDQEVKDLVIPNTVTYIGHFTFAECSSLTSVTIPNSVTSIGRWAFYNIDSIQSIFCTPLLPPSTENEIFGQNVYDNATLYVLSSDYKTHNTWKRFSNIQVLDTIYSGELRYNLITHSGQLLSESLLTEESFNKFTKVSVEGTQTWRYNGSYGASMSGYQNSTTHPNEDWFISPAIDLEDCASATLTFSHAFGPKAEIPTSASKKAQYTIWVSNDFEGDVKTATWTQLSGLQYGTTAWQYISSGNITIPKEKLAANCRIAWKYVCSSSSATWEIKNISLVATAEADAKPTLRVIDNNPKYAGDIVIPASVKFMDVDFAVKSVGSAAFRDCKSLDSVVIENGVTKIEDSAFMGSSLASISIPNSVTSIEYSAFKDCSLLTSITIPESVTNIGRLMLSGCSSLASIAVATDNAIYDSRNDCNAIIESRTNTLVAGCSNTIIPRDIRSIGANAFLGCSSLTSITIPESVTTVREYAFDYCTALSSVVFSKGIESIERYAFAHCSSLSSVNIPNGVTSISGYAFSSSSSLDTIYVEAEVPPTLGTTVFDGAPVSLCYIPCGTLTAYSSSEWSNQVGELVEECNKCGKKLRWQYNDTLLSITGYGDMYDYDLEPQPWLQYRNKLQTITLQEGMTSIGASAFAECKYVKSVTIPATVRKIHDSAFEDCRMLTTLTFAEPSTLNSIGNWAFYNCHKLQHVTIPEGVTEIGEAAFFDCTYLNELTLPASMEYIADNGFALCAKLRRMNVSATTPPQVEARTFEDVDRSIPVVVPDASVNAYKAAPVWQEFNIVGKNNVPSAVDNVDASNRSTQKLLRDGHLVIIRDGVEYNVMGQQL